MTKHNDPSPQAVCNTLSDLASPIFKLHTGSIRVNKWAIEHKVGAINSDTYIIVLVIVFRVV